MHCCWSGFGRCFAVLFSISLCGFTYSCVVFPKPFGFSCVFLNPCHFLICIHIIFNGKVHVFGGNTHRRGTKEQFDKVIYGFPFEVLNSPPMGFSKIVKSTLHWNTFCFCLSCPLKPLQIYGHLIPPVAIQVDQVYNQVQFISLQPWEILPVHQQTKWPTTRKTTWMPTSSTVARIGNQAHQLFWIWPSS